MNTTVQDWLRRPGGIAERLLELRTSAGLLQSQINATCEWPAAKASKLESGRQMPTARDIESWCKACGSEDAIDDLLELLRQGQAVQERARRRAPVRLPAPDVLLQDVSHVRGLALSSVPPLLQTADYARWVLGGHRSPTPDPVVEAAVSERLRLQHTLYDTAGSRRFEWVIAEPALRWRVAPPAVMRAQLDRLSTVAGLTNVRLGVVSLEAEVVVPSVAFDLYDDSVVIDTPAGPVAGRPSDLATYDQVMAELWAVAETGEAAQQLLRRIAAATG